MSSRFTYKDVNFTVTRHSEDDDRFEIAMTLDGQSIRSKVRTRLRELAKRRAEMLIDRKLKDKSKSSPVV